MSDGMPQAVASHSWNMAIMAMVLQPYLQNEYDMCRVLELCLLHDLPEVVQQEVLRGKYIDSELKVYHFLESYSS